MLPWPYRLYFWAVHGVCAEVVFTAIWEFVVGGSWTLKGYSSLWSILTYGLGTFLVAEYLCGYMVSRQIPLMVRCAAYVPMTYACEFTFGAVLSYFDACPWDYTPFDYDFMGLVTLEYAPLWFLAGLYMECIMSVMRSLEESPSCKRKTL